MTVTIINNAYIIPGNNLPDIPKGRIVIDDDVITHVDDKCDAPPPDGAVIVDGSGAIVKPGDVDNHRHMWQSVVLGKAVNDDVWSYALASVWPLAANYTPAASAFGVRFSAYQAIDSGITTLANWDHGSQTLDHAKAQADALAASGIRGQHMAGPIVLEWFSPDNGPADVDGPPAPDDVRALKAHIDKLDNPKVSMALAIRGPESSTDERVAADFALADELGLAVHSHAGMAGLHDTRPTVRILEAMGLLNDGVTLSHCNEFTRKDFKRLKNAGAHVSLCPEVDRGQGYGEIPLRTCLEHGPVPSLSTDVPAYGEGSIATAARFALNAQRHNDYPGERETVLRAEKALEWMTIAGAESMGLGDETGSLEVGKQADVVLIDATSPRIAGHLSPRAAVAMSVTPADIRDVWIAGKLVKEDGRVVGYDGHEILAEIKEHQDTILDGIDD